MSKQPATIEVDVHGRWDAVELLRRLVPYHSYLVERGRGRWCVHAQAPGYNSEKLPDALAAIDECLRERRVEDAAVRVDGEPCRPTTEARAREAGRAR
jgi:hypothetical protein